MATAFRRKGDRLVGRLSEEERGLVIELLARTRDLLAPPEDEPTGDVFTDLVAGLGEDGPDPDELAGRDSALRRLLPDGHREDPEIASEFRRLTEHGLRRTKASRLSAAIEALELEHGERRSKVSLDLEQGQALMIALTDVRLVLADRMGLQDDEDGDRLHDRLEEAQDLTDPLVVFVAYYDFLSWLQESLAQALTT